MNNPVYPPVDFAALTDEQLSALYKLYRPRETIEFMTRIMDELIKRKLRGSVYLPQIGHYEPPLTPYTIC